MKIPSLLFILMSTVAGVVVVSYLAVNAPNLKLEQRRATRLGNSGFIDKSGRLVCHALHVSSYRFHYSNGFRKEQVGGMGDPKHKQKAFSFFDKSGKRAFSQEFYECEDFSEGLCAVRTFDGQWGFIDARGNFAIQPIFENAHSFKDGFAPVKQSDKWGFVRKDGSWLLKPTFENARPFREGLALIKLNGKVGYINTSGNIQIPAVLDQGQSFSDGVAKVGKNPTKSEDGYIKCIDVNGSVKTITTIPASNDGRSYMMNSLSNYDSFRLASGQNYDEIRPIISEFYDESPRFSDNRAVRLKDYSTERYGYVDKDGNVAIPYKFEHAATFSEGLARVRVAGEYGFIAPSGKFIITPRFKQAHSFHEGLAFVEEKDGKCGFINHNGKLVIRINGTTAGDFYDGLAAVGDYSPMLF